MQAASPIAPAPMPAAATLGPTRPTVAMPQHLRALEHANRVRLARAALKRAIQSGDLEVSHVVRTCPWEIESMTIGELLRSQRRWGRARTRKFLASIALNENRAMVRLTERQRGLLAAELESKANRRR